MASNYVSSNTKLIIFLCTCNNTGVHVYVGGWRYRIIITGWNESHHALSLHHFFFVTARVVMQWQLQWWSACLLGQSWLRSYRDGWFLSSTTSAGLHCVVGC